MENSIYKDVMRIVLMRQYDSSMITAQLILEYPEIFLKLATAKPSPEWVEGVNRLLASDKIVEAIKMVREKTGFGLKEAKDILDNYRCALADRGYVTSRPSSACMLSMDHMGTFNLLLESSKNAFER